MPYFLFFWDLYLHYRHPKKVGEPIFSLGFSGGEEVRRELFESVWGKDFVDGHNLANLQAESCDSGGVGVWLSLFI